MGKLWFGSGHRRSGTLRPFEGTEVEREGGEISTQEVLNYAGDLNKLRRSYHRHVDPGYTGREPAGEA